MEFKFKKDHLPVLMALFSLCFMFYGVFEYSAFNDGLSERNIRSKLLESLISRKSQLEKSLFSRIYYTKSVAAYVSINGDISGPTFRKLAEAFYQDDSVICTMSLSKNCIITAVFPMKGHESAIGLNLLEHPNRRKIVEETVLTRNTFVAGPVELVEGGIAFISYTPVFTGNADEPSGFWGVTDIVLYRDRLFKEAHLVTQDDDFIYGMKGIDGSGSRGGIFWGDSTVFSKQPVMVEISLPTGSWILAGAPTIGWRSYIHKSDNFSILLYIISFIISFLIWLLVRVQIKIRTHEKELRVSNETKDKFFSIIAHDLRSPFNVFLGYTEIMADDLDHMPHEQLRQIVRSLRSSALHLNSLLENLLEWSRLQMKATSFEPSTFLLRPNVTESLEYIRDSANNKKIEISVDIPEDLSCFADLHMFQTVIRNLTSNAVKYTPKGGKVKVSARKTENHAVEVSVSDTGIGMNADLLGRVFRHTGQITRKGTEGEPSSGLGLILCREFVEKHGGEIRIDSEEGKGSIFYFTIP